MRRSADPDLHQGTSKPPSSLPQEILDIIIAYAVQPAASEPSSVFVDSFKDLCKTPSLQIILGPFLVNEAIYRQALHTFIASREWSLKVIPGQMGSLRPARTAGDQEPQMRSTLLIMPGTHSLRRLQLRIESQNPDYRRRLNALVEEIVNQLPTFYPRLQELALHVSHPEPFESDQGTKPLDEWRAAVKDTVESLRKSLVAKRYISLAQTYSVLRMCHLIPDAGGPSMFEKEVAKGRTLEIIDCRDESSEEVTAGFLKRRKLWMAVTAYLDSEKRWRV